jgi:hypothetical protein
MPGPEILPRSTAVFHSRSHSVRAGFGAGIVMALLLLSSFAGGAWAAGSVSLRYRLKPNATYEQSNNTHLSVKIEVEGGPESQAAMMQQMLGGGLEQKMRVVNRLVVGASSEDGSLPLSITVEEMEQSITAGGREVPVSGQMSEMTGKVFKGRISGDGRSIEVDEMTGVPGGTAQNIMNAMPKYPDADLSVGGKFEIPVSVSVPVPAAGGEVDMKGNAIYVLERIEGGKAHFSVRQTFSIGVGSEGANAGGLSMVGGGLGTAIYDQAEGVFSSVKMDMDFQISLSMGGLIPPSGGEAAQGMSGANLKIKMTGPVESTIKRVVSGN